MIVAINFSNRLYQKQRIRNTISAYKIGKVDNVISYNEENIDTEFLQEYSNIFQYPRGAGLWLWKPYIINKTLTTLKNDDYLIYTDSGSIYIKNVKNLIRKLHNSHQSIMLFETPLVECQWTKKEVLIQLDAYNEDIRFSPQIMGTFLIIRKSEHSVQFINRWLELCTKENLLCPKQKDITEDELYLEHREDQSILSILAKKEGIIPFSDPSDYGKFLNQYLRPERLFLLKNKNSDNHIDRTYFLHTRNSNQWRYLVNFYIKCLLNRFGLRKISI